MFLLFVALTACLGARATGRVAADPLRALRYE